MAQTGANNTQGQTGAGQPVRRGHFATDRIQILKAGASMIRIIFWFAVLAAVTFGATWLADRPGSISIEWLGYRIENLSVGVALLAIAALFITIWLAWSIFKWVLGRPGAFGGYFARRRERIGREALSKGLIAVGAGDEKSALQYARTASKKLPGDPLAKLLEAQSALYQGDSARVTSVYREMTQTPQTRLLGLRGLFNEARKAKNIEAARGYAKQALKENPGTVWASNAMAAACSAEGDWPCVLEILENQKKAGTLDPDEFKRKKAVVLAAQALSLEDRDLEAATDLAVSAHRLDPSLVPAAVVAGRTLSALGSLRKASRILEKTWKLSPHPDIAEVYIHARPGDSVTDRLKRAKDLVRVYHGKEEGALALAKAAIEAGEWKTAREALNPYIHDRPRARVCMVMAQLENAEFGDKGRAREWLARAV
ncbi:MAG TPA: heme biosynthesis protein HemY, partial [Rhizobiales bacterium]|nr:heme biosynthesis protein HemY [Hyphomicrobiales bacterium]